MKIATDGIRLNLVNEGTGTPALVFLRYQGGSSRTWPHVAAALLTAFVRSVDTGG